ncbi:MAG: UDP-4-amino-4,6-dideoxy-N-acetyl-beta-L-altrosamine N-acetyltransferase [Candidatus Zixiibacteriota bacterium]|nr:MAG: UDP-4-amino-4,6-dideoxy-N-acetyl-beta-L-altrosamine N-acetyltransferase [candidate division Zixibacteria bacterium]
MPDKSDFRLRPLAEADLDLVLKWRNSDRVRKHMYTDHIITPEEHRAWSERMKTNPDTHPQVFEYQNRPIGVINLSRVDRPDGRCVWGFYLGEPNLPKGCGAALGYFGLEHIFEHLKFRKVVGEVFSFNSDSLKFHKRLGFVEEGRLAQHVLKNNEYHDIITLALFDETWRAGRPALEEKLFSMDETVCRD